MTHNWERTNWIKEGTMGFGAGVLYGLTSVVVGHPFDTVKTKMQAQVGFEKTSMMKTFLKTLRTQGLVGLYRGWIPPLLGSGVYRSVQFASFEAVYTIAGRYNFTKKELPFTNGLQIRVLLGSVCASTIRAIIETPLEYAKVRRQIQQSWRLRDVYTGFGITYVRCIGLLSTYFILIDSGRRHFPEHFNRPLFGPFVVSGCAATFAWWVVWPLEYLKSQVQGDYKRPVSSMQRLHLIIKNQNGWLGLYRGILPGSIRSFVANGTAMVVMQFAQRKMTEWGYRD